MKKTLFIAAICVFYAMSVWGQTPSIQLTAPQVTPVSPEAAAVQRYASYPVSHATGIPNINIPLYEIKVGDLTLPISLSYHASGFRPKERNGWVGAGWTLNAEPSLMRTIQGLPDDDMPAASGINKYGYFYNDGNSDNSEYTYEGLEFVFRGYLDEEPDIYSYKLANGGGTAIPNRARTFLSFPLNNVKIVRIDENADFSITEENGVKYLMGGNNAYRETTGVETANPRVTRWVCREMQSAKTNAKITFEYEAARQTLQAFNLTDNVVVEDNIQQPMCYKQSGISKYNYSIGIDGDLNYESNRNLFSMPPIYDEKPLERQFISKINFDNGYVTFEAMGTTIDKRLNVIKVFDNQGNCLRRIAFYISLYTQRHNAEHTKLDSIVIVAPNCNSCQNMVYRFDYISPDGVAPMLTKAIDHWGFANAPFLEEDNAIAVPTIKNVLINRYVNAGVSTSVMTTTVNTVYGRNREANEEYAKKGVLYRITSPEGVETTFEYEGNYTIVQHYGSNNDLPSNYNHFHFFGDRDTIPLGGLRVKKITERDTHTGIRNFRNYTYGYIRQPSYEGISYIEYGGIPKRLVTSNDYCFQQEMTNIGFQQWKWDTSAGTINGTTAGFDGISRLRTWGSMPMTNITFNNGSAILYGCVTERKSTHYAANNGMSDDVITKYYYSTPPAYLQFDSYGVPQIHNWIDETKREYLAAQKYVNALTIPCDAQNYEELQYGLLTKVEQFKDNGATLVSQTNYTYGKNDSYRLTHPTYYDIENGKAQAIKVYQTRICAQCYDGTFNPDGFYGRYAGVPSSKDDAFAKLEWDYPALAFPLLKDSTITYFENGNKVTTKAEYQYRPNFDHLNPVQITRTNSNGVVQKEVFSYEPLTKTVNNTFYSLLALRSYKQITGTDTVYSQMDYYPNNSQNKFRPEKVLYKTSKMSALEDRVKFLRYDAYGNPAEVWDYTGMTTCYLWGYNCQYPILKVENISYENLLAALSRNETWVKNLGESKYPYNNDELAGLIFMLQNNVDNYNIAVTNYQYKPLVGVTQMTDSRRQTTYFDYDSFGRLTDTYITNNSGKKKLAHNAYNLVGAYHGFFSANFAGNYQGNIYSYNQERTFSVNVEGGSGNFKYDWELRYIDDNEEVTEHFETTIPSVTLTPHPNTMYFIGSDFDKYVIALDILSNITGMKWSVNGTNGDNPIPQINQLRCKITDNVTGAESEISTWFYVKE